MSLADDVVALKDELQEIRRELATHDHSGGSSKYIERLTVSNLLTGLISLVPYDFENGTVGGPEDDPNPQEGWIYARSNYDAGGTNDLRVYIDGAWSSVTVT